MTSTFADNLAAIDGIVHNVNVAAKKEMHSEITTMMLQNPWVCSFVLNKYIFNKFSKVMSY